MEWWWLIPLFLGGIPMLFFHELSHYLVVVGHQKRKVLVFRPWPHWYEGTFYFGRVQPDGDLGPMQAISSIGPFIKALILIPWYLFLCSMIDWWHLLPLVGWELWDIIWWWRGWFLEKASTDGGRIEDMADGED